MNYPDKGGIAIQENKIYYNQQHVISEIRNRTGCSANDIARILTSLGDMVRDKFGDKNSYVEIKLFPGLKIASHYIPPQQSKSNLDISKSDFILNLSASFSDYFRKEIRRLHRNTL